jgi:PAS domain S-box-containing protein
VQLDGRIFAANEAAAKLIGVPAAELQGRHAITDLTHPGDLVRTSALFQEISAGREETQAFEARYLHRDGRPVRASVTSSLVRDKRGNPAFVIAAVEPLDKATQLKEELAVARKAAHDLNNLLAVITGHAELALEALPPGGEARSSLEEIQAASERSASLVLRILAPRSVAQPSAEAVNVNDVILGLRDIARFLVGLDIRTVLELDPTHPRAWADEESLALALANILRNSGEAMPEGGTLTIRTLTIRVESDGFVGIAVTDTGIGMTGETVAKLSEPGFTTKPSGHGIGLFSVRQFAEAHGGRLEITSAPGEGTTVTLWLRRAPAPAPN